MSDAARHPDARVRRVVTLFEALAPADLARLGEVYAPQARFKDPFNEVQGPDAIGRIFAHMFETLEAPRFVVQDALVDGNQAFLTWDFECRRRGSRGAALRIHGGTHLRFDAQGRVLLHRDYWDAAEELYERLPLLGALMRWLKRRLSATSPSGGSR
ncbi:MAG: nuclear transport factor 2 family protein [Burkholderiales bacterium]|nr:nuclear transport factor 2 family protein [Burkholderiales bacterium]